MYRHILLATDLAEDMAAVEARALALSSGASALSVIHVIEPLALAYGAEMPVDLAALQEELERQARSRLNALAARLGIQPASALLAQGKTEKEILGAASRLGADLIVLGSHGRHGLGLLLGSTANAVLHHAHCDVLAVRITRT
jgi:universal stress protein A